MNKFQTKEDRYIKSWFQPDAYSSLRSIKRLAVFPLSPGWDASPLQRYPSMTFLALH